MTSLEPQVLLDTLTFVVDFHRDDSVLEFLRVRRILEPAAAAMAAQLIDDAAVTPRGTVSVMPSTLQAPGSKHKRRYLHNHSVLL